ncbi:MAG: hypothetical protein K0U72_08825 [Gammaproteobacteria bacterium]|nr:hypothetical protein [Gammaproteobacteria bacterium]
MKSINYAASLLVAFSCLLLADASADEQSAAYEASFQAIVDDLNEDSFELFHRAISKNDMTQRIVSAQMISQQARNMLDESFEGGIQEMFVEAFPSAQGKSIQGTLISFQTEGDRGTAVVRFGLPNYRYAYHVFELQLASRDRVVIVDWVNYLLAKRFSERAAEQLVAVLPSEAAVRRVFAMPGADENQAFQMRELLKAYRDNQGERFFAIVDGLDEGLQNNPAVYEREFRIAERVQNPERYQKAALRIIANKADDPLFVLSIADYHLMAGDYQSALDSLDKLGAAIGVQDAATASRQSALALALANTSEAERFALLATQSEPDFELGWWSLLRARSGAGDNEGSLEALTQLEDHFGHELTEAKLRRDKFRGFAALAAS